MRLRKPERQPPEMLKITACEQTRTYQVTTITPIFGGGVEPGVPDRNMPIRATAIRGQLRYWWRFLASHRETEAITEHQELFKKERNIWGGMGEDGEDYSSKVFIRIRNVKHYHEETYDGNVAAYALFPAREEKKRPAKKLFKEGIKFDLFITSPKDYWPELEKVIRWWMTFGGIGSRTRRGVGSFEIKVITDAEPDKLMSSISEEEAKQHQCQLIIGKYHSNNVIRAWEKAVQYLHDFRQKEGIARKPSTANTPGRSLWPEADSIRKIVNTHSVHKTVQRTKHINNVRVNEPYQCHDHTPKHPAMISFPRAYFGLPINFHFKDVDCGEPDDVQLTPEHSERLASPLILTPYRLEPKSDSKYAPAALLMPYSPIDSIAVQLTRNHQAIPNRPQNLSNEAQEEWRSNRWENWMQQWWHPGKAKHTPIHQFNPENNDPNPLEAFLKFFDQEE